MFSTHTFEKVLICIDAVYSCNYLKNVAITFDIFRNYFNSLQLLCTHIGDDLPYTTSISASYYCELLLALKLLNERTRTPSYARFRTN